MLRKAPDLVTAETPSPAQPAESHHTPKTMYGETLISHHIVNMTDGEQYICVIVPRDRSSQSRNFAGYLTKKPTGYMLQTLEPGEILTNTDGTTARYCQDPEETT